MLRISRGSSAWGRLVLHRCLLSLKSCVLCLEAGVIVPKLNNCLVELLHLAAHGRHLRKKVRFGLWRGLRRKGRWRSWELWSTHQTLRGLFVG